MPYQTAVLLIDENFSNFEQAEGALGTIESKRKRVGGCTLRLCHLRWISSLISKGHATLLWGLVMFTRIGRSLGGIRSPLKSRRRDYDQGGNSFNFMNPGGTAPSPSFVRQEQFNQFRSSNFRQGSIRPVGGGGYATTPPRERTADRARPFKRRDVEENGSPSMSGDESDSSDEDEESDSEEADEDVASESEPEPSDS